MTTLLAIDASSAQCCIALSDQDNCISRVLTQPNAQTKQLLPAIRALLAQAQLSYQQLDALVLGVGPGRFTGLRVASSVVQGIAMAADLPVVRVSSLQVLAQSSRRLNPGIEHFAVVNNAHMQEVYVGLYHVVKGVCEPVTEDAIMPPARLKVPFTAPWAAVGDGWDVYPQPLDAVRLAASDAAAVLYPHAESLVFLGQRAWQEDKVCGYQYALPNYLRRAKAWKKNAG